MADSRKVTIVHAKRIPGSADPQGLTRNLNRGPPCLTALLRLQGRLLLPFSFCLSSFSFVSSAECSLLMMSHFPCRDRHALEWLPPKLVAALRVRGRDRLDQGGCIAGKTQILAWLIRLSHQGSPDPKRFGAYQIARNASTLVSHSAHPIRELHVIPRAD